MTAVVSGQVDVIAQATTLIALITQRNPARKLEAKLPLQNSLLGVGLHKGTHA